MAITMRTRLADVAVSLPLVIWPDEPFVSRVRAFNGFVSSMSFAPAVSIVGAHGPSGLALSFLYLDTELDRARADRVADAVTQRVWAAIRSAA
jgi:hypothetical protein